MDHLVKLHTPTSHARRRLRSVFACLAAFVPVTSLVGCASSQRDAKADATYTLVYLKTGPKSGQKTREESTNIFRGHMDNMRRLADEGHLIIAGPFDKPADQSWRGIFLLDVAGVESARQITATDPGVIEGVFTAELHPFLASPDLRRTLALEQEHKAANPQDIPKPGAPPANIRAYVMITAKDASKASRAIADSSIGQHVVWWGRFKESKGGVFVVDAEKAEDVRSVLSGADMGECAVDGWWSTTTLTRLPREPLMTR